MVNRVSTAQLYLRNMRDIGRVMGELNELNGQISSGKKSDSFAAINDGVARIVGYQDKLSKIDNYITNNKAVITRLDSANTAITSVQTIASDYRAMLTQWKTDGNERGNSFVQQARGFLDQIAGQLNVKVEGRYIFSGTRTDTAPVTQPVPNPISFGIADDGYYQGDNEDLTIRVSDSYEINYGTKANDPAFQELITSIKTAIQADATNDPDMFNSALDLVNSAVEDLTDVAAKVNSAIVSIENVNVQHTQVQVYIKGALGSETDTDIAEATSKLAVDQTILQATFSAFAKISRLTLTDYLN